MTSEKWVQKFSLCSRRLEVVGEREDVRTRGRTRRVRERLHGRPPKIVSTRILWVWKFPIGQEAPKGKSYHAGRENCQSIVHGQRSEDLILHHLKPLNCIQSKFRSWRSLQSGLIIVGLCGCNLKEKLEWSNSIHDGKNWHQIRISRSGERQKICQIIAMKSRGHILCSGELGGLCCQWNPYHQNLDETLTRGMNVKKRFTIVLFAVWRGSLSCQVRHSLDLSFSTEDGMLLVLALAWIVTRNICLLAGYQTNLLVWSHLQRTSNMLLLVSFEQGA